MNRPSELTARIEDARRELQALRDAARDLTARLRLAQRQAAHARALDDEEADVAVRMDRLEAVLDLAAVTRHAREAIAGARMIEGPFRCAVVEGLLPDAVHRAAVEAIPSPIFMAEDRGSPGGIAVPPKVAPTYAVATWLFLNDVAKDLIGPALAERVSAASAPALRLSRSHLVRHGPQPSQDAAPGRDEVLLLVVHLGTRAPTLAWALPGGAGVESLGPEGRWQDADGESFDWRVGFRLSETRGTRSRRRHGDLASWTPAETSSR